MRKRRQVGSLCVVLLLLLFTGSVVWSAWFWTRMQAQGDETATPNSAKATAAAAASLRYSKNQPTKLGNSNKKARTPAVASKNTPSAAESALSVVVSTASASEAPPPTTTTTTTTSAAAALADDELMMGDNGAALNTQSAQTAELTQEPMSTANNVVLSDRFGHQAKWEPRDHDAPAAVRISMAKPAADGEDASSPTASSGIRAAKRLAQAIQRRGVHVQQRASPKDKRLAQPVSTTKQHVDAVTECFALSPGTAESLKPRLLVHILVAPSDLARLRAIRSSWNPFQPSDFLCGRFIVGEPFDGTDRTGDVHVLPFRDSPETLGKKRYMAMQLAANTPSWQVYLQMDSDSFVRFTPLMKKITAEVDLSKPVVLAAINPVKIDDQTVWHPSRMGMAMTRPAVEAIAFNCHDCPVDAGYPFDDVLVGVWVSLMNVTLIEVPAEQFHNRLKNGGSRDATVRKYEKVVDKHSLLIHHLRLPDYASLRAMFASDEPY